MVIGNSASNYKTDAWLQIKILLLHKPDTTSHLFQEWYQLSHFDESSFESFNVHGKQPITDLVLLYQRAPETYYFVSVRLMLLLFRLTHYAAIKNNRRIEKSSNKGKNSNLHGCENLTSDDSSTRENTRKTTLAKLSIRAQSQLLAQLILPLPQFLAFHKNL